MTARARAFESWGRCACGTTHLAGAAQAGASLDCSCGRTLRVPPPAAPGEAGYGATWSVVGRHRTPWQQRFEWLSMCGSLAAGAAFFAVVFAGVHVFVAAVAVMTGAAIFGEGVVAVIAAVARAGRARPAGSPGWGAARRPGAEGTPRAAARAAKARNAQHAARSHA